MDLTVIGFGGVGQHLHQPAGGDVGPHMIVAEAAKPDPGSAMRRTVSLLARSGAIHPRGRRRACPSAL